MTTTINDVGTRIMNDHGIYPLLDTLTNDALLSTVYPDDIIDPVSLYVDAKGLHLVWRTAKKDENGHDIWNGGNLLLYTKSMDVTAEFAAKLDYDGEAPDFDNTAEDNGDDPWFVTAPEVDDGYMFTLCGLKDDEGTHVSHIFATDGHHGRILLSANPTLDVAAIEHWWIWQAIGGLSSEDVTRLDADADTLSKARDLLK